MPKPSSTPQYEALRQLVAEELQIEVSRPRRRRSSVESDTVPGEPDPRSSRAHIPPSDDDIELPSPAEEEHPRTRGDSPSDDGVGSRMKGWWKKFTGGDREAADGRRAGRKATDDGRRKKYVSRGWLSQDIPGAPVTGDVQGKKTKGLGGLGARLFDMTPEDFGNLGDVSDYEDLDAPGHE